MSNVTTPLPAFLRPTPPRNPGLARLGRLLVGLSLLLFFSGLLAAAATVIALVAPGPATEKKIVIIPAQLGLRGIGSALMEQGLIYHPLQFTLPAKLLEADNLKPGEYEFRPQMSVLDILAQLRAGKTIIHKITLPEGLTNGDIARLLEAEPLLTEPVGALPPEGGLFPATYHFSYGDKRAQIITQMSKLAQSTLQELWEKRAADLPLQTPQQALILASMVEKETGEADERARIAGVFYNRLRLGMKLQSDPTVIYALTLGKTPFKRSLTSADLAFVSPYNTYVTAGLPPAPIANPGRAALQAVLHPEKHDFLYFVADGSGGHAFAKTLDAHNRNVAAWRKLSR